MYDPRFLPICKEDLDELGWDYVDVIIISADAYVDHPCFGHAVVGRLLEHEGLRVAILPQPNWRDDLRDFKKLGKPRATIANTLRILNLDDSLQEFVSRIAVEHTLILEA